ncbi:hypothetical protein U1Q18_026438 [Sarracenia purpurea var. burkii]
MMCCWDGCFGSVVLCNVGCYGCAAVGVAMVVLLICFSGDESLDVMLSNVAPALQCGLLWMSCFCFGFFGCLTLVVLCSVAAA